jgi:hypothetical protein
VVADQSGAVVSGAVFKLVNPSQQTVYQAISDRQGLYSFPNFLVGHYDLTITASGFTAQKKTNLTVDTDSAIRLDVALTIGTRSDTMTVTSDSGTQIETSATHLGEVVSGAQMTALPLNGRTYTDLLSIQPGVAPLSTLLPSSVIMAGVTGSIDPSGDATPGNLSINGQRESANGFMVNGIDVQEHMNGGTSIIPNLDSIEEFRVLTNNFDPEYGNYNGGIVTVVSKTGSNAFHGGVFEFSATQISMQRATSIKAALLSTRISSAAFSADRSDTTRYSSTPTIREHEPLRVSRPETSRSRPWPSATATLTI